MKLRKTEAGWYKFGDWSIFMLKKGCWRAVGPKPRRQAATFPTLRAAKAFVRKVTG